MTIDACIEKEVRSVHLPLVLFVCRTNSTCSIMAEAILRHLAPQRVRTASGGEFPQSEVNPFALGCLRMHRIPTQGLRCKTWGEFFGLDRPSPRFLIALGDGYAAKAHWPEETLIGSWHMPDPGAVAGSDIDMRVAFEEAFDRLDSQIQKFLALPLEKLAAPALAQELKRIGEAS